MTRSQYAAWLATKPVFEEGRCVFLKNDFSPDPKCMKWPEVCQGEACATHPQVCVSYCSAEAFCRDSGKRLCGVKASPPQDNQWQGACTQGWATQYPWGDDEDPSRCNLHGGTTVPVASDHRCSSSAPGFEGIYDLIGNVREWVGPCKDSDIGPYCRISGGDFAGLSPDDCGSEEAYQIDFSTVIGIRCCAD